MNVVVWIGDGVLAAEMRRLSNDRCRLGVNARRTLLNATYILPIVYLLSPAAYCAYNGCRMPPRFLPLPPQRFP